MRRQNRQKSVSVRNSDGSEVRNFCRFSHRQKVGKSGKRSPSTGQAQPFGSSAGLVQVRASGKRYAALSVEKICMWGPGEPFGGFESCSLTKHSASLGLIRFGREGPHRGLQFYLAIPRTLPAFFYAPLRVSLRRPGRKLLSRRCMGERQGGAKARFNHVWAADRAADRRRGDNSLSPIPKASQHGETSSALASISSLARFGRVAPVSVMRTSVSEVSEHRPSSRRDKPRAVRVSRKRCGKPAHSNSVESAQGCSIPKARKQGETCSAVARCSTVSSRGMLTPCSNSKAVEPPIPAVRASAACDRSKALRMRRSRAANRMCRGFF